MSLLGVTYLDLLHELCQQRGYVLLLTAEHRPSGFASISQTRLRTLSVAKPCGLAGLSRRQRLQAGARIARCQLDTVGGDLDAAAELLVQLLTREQSRTA